MAKDLYQILQIPREASDKEVRTAYRNLAKRYHPDAGASSSAARFREIQDAYETLGDPARRAAYDREREHDAAVRFAPPMTWPVGRPDNVTRTDDSHLDLSGIFGRPRPETIGLSSAWTARAAYLQPEEWPDLDEILRMLDRLDDLDW